MRFEKSFVTLNNLFLAKLKGQKHYIGTPLAIWNPLTLGKAFWIVELWNCGIVVNQPISHSSLVSNDPSLPSLKSKG